ncbi:MAG: glycosyltransferase [Chitinophagaceae bacterium]
MKSINTETLTGKKILFASMPAEGHVNPLTGLAKYLQSKGCDVRWYTGSSYSSKMEKLGIPLFPFRKAVEVTGENLEELFPGREKIKGQVKRLVYDMIHVFIRQAPKFIDDMQEIHKDFPFDVVVAECTFTAIPLIKKVLKVPVVGVGIVPLTETSRDLPPVGLGMTPTKTFIGRIKQGFLRFITNEILFRKANVANYEILDSYGVEYSRSNMFDIAVKASDLYLQSGTPGFEYRRSDMGKNIRFIGSLLPYSPGKKTAPWNDTRLKQYQTIVLVTQGTVEKDTEKLLVPTLEAFKDTSTLVICTTGGSQTEELRKRFPQRNLVIEDFIPFDNIMPYANVYITNGGYGGVMLGIENELPMVVAGVHEGKNEICARVGYFKLGINLGTEKPKPEQIRAAVEKIIADTTYRANVEKLGKEFNCYNPGELSARYISNLLNQPGKSRTAIIVNDVAA